MQDETARRFFPPGGDIVTVHARFPVCARSPELERVELFAWQIDRGHHHAGRIHRNSCVIGNGRVCRPDCNYDNGCDSDFQQNAHGLSPLASRERQHRRAQFDSI